jgi:hypothetical protein
LLLEGVPDDLGHSAPLESSRVVRDVNHMFLHHTSTEQRRAVLPTNRRRMPAQLDLPKALWADGIDGTGRYLRLDARSHIQGAKAAIVAEMRKLNRPVTSAELHKNFDGAWSLSEIEFDLSTLVKEKIVEVAYGPELHFGLVDGGDGTKGFTRERCR